MGAGCTVPSDGVASKRVESVSRPFSIGPVPPPVSAVTPSTVVAAEDSKVVTDDQVTVLILSREVARRARRSNLDHLSNFAKANDQLLRKSTTKGSRKDKSMPAQNKNADEGDAEDERESSSPVKSVDGNRTNRRRADTSVAAEAFYAQPRRVAGHQRPADALSPATKTKHHHHHHCPASKFQRLTRKWAMEIYDRLRQKRTPSPDRSLGDFLPNAKRQSELSPSPPRGERTAPSRARSPSVTAANVQFTPPDVLWRSFLLADGLGYSSEASEEVVSSRWQQLRQYDLALGAPKREESRNRYRAAWRSFREASRGVKNRRALIRSHLSFVFTSSDSDNDGPENGGLLPRGRDACGLLLTRNTMLESPFAPLRYLHAPSDEVEEASAPTAGVGHTSSISSVDDWLERSGNRSFSSGSSTGEGKPQRKALRELARERRSRSRRTSGSSSSSGDESRQGLELCDCTSCSCSADSSDGLLSEADLGMSSAHRAVVEATIEKKKAQFQGGPFCKRRQWSRWVRATIMNPAAKVSVSAVRSIAQSCIEAQKDATRGSASPSWRFFSSFFRRSYFPFNLCSRIPAMVTNQRRILKSAAMHELHVCSVHPLAVESQNPPSIIKEILGEELPLPQPCSIPDTIMTVLNNHEVLGPAMTRRHILCCAALNASTISLSRIAITAHSILGFKIAYNNRAFVKDAKQAQLERVQKQTNQLPSKPPQSPSRSVPQRQSVSSSASPVAAGSAPPAVLILQPADVLFGCSRTVRHTTSVPELVQCYSEKSGELHFKSWVQRYAAASNTPAAAPEFSPQYSPAKQSAPRQLLVLFPHEYELALDECQAALRYWARHQRRLTVLSPSEVPLHVPASQIIQEGSAAQRHTLCRQLSRSMRCNSAATVMLHPSKYKAKKWNASFSMESATSKGASTSLASGTSGGGKKTHFTREAVAVVAVSATGSIAPSDPIMERWRTLNLVGDATTAIPESLLLGLHFTHRHIERAAREVACSKTEDRGTMSQFLVTTIAGMLPHDNQLAAQFDDYNDFVGHVRNVLLASVKGAYLKGAEVLRMSAELTSDSLERGLLAKQAAVSSAKPLVWLLQRQFHYLSDMTLYTDERINAATSHNLRSLLCRCTKKDDVSLPVCLRHPQTSPSTVLNAPLAQNTLSAELLGLFGSEWSTQAPHPTSTCTFYVRESSLFCATTGNNCAAVLFNASPLLQHVVQGGLRLWPTSGGMSLSTLIFGDDIAFAPAIPGGLRSPNRPPHFSESIVPSGCCGQLFLPLAADTSGVPLSTSCAISLTSSLYAHSLADATKKGFHFSPQQRVTHERHNVLERQGSCGAGGPSVSISYVDMQNAFAAPPNAPKRDVGASTDDFSRSVAFFSSLGGEARAIHHIRYGKSNPSPNSVVCTASTDVWTHASPVEVSLFLGMLTTCEWCCNAASAGALQPLLASAGISLPQYLLHCVKSMPINIPALGGVVKDSFKCERPPPLASLAAAPRGIDAIGDVARVADYAASFGPLCPVTEYLLANHPSISETTLVMAAQATLADLTQPKGDRLRHALAAARMVLHYCEAYWGPAEDWVWEEMSAAGVADRAIPPTFPTPPPIHVRMFRHLRDIQLGGKPISVANCSGIVSEPRDGQAEDFSNLTVLVSTALTHTAAAMDTLRLFRQLTMDAMRTRREARNIRTVPALPVRTALLVGPKADANVPPSLKVVHQDDLLLVSAPKHYVAQVLAFK